MREIKFRYVLKVYNTSRDDPAYYEWLELKVFTLGDLENNGLNKWILKEFNGIIETIAKDQYTGLKDKNGKEIYEGDVVKCKLSSTQRYKGIIQFKTGHFFIHAFWYSFKPIGRWDLEKRQLCGKSDTNLSIDCEMQIIGNIYENSELIKS